MAQLMPVPRLRYLPAVKDEPSVLRLQREANAVALAPDGRRAAVGLQDTCETCILGVDL